jgi:hypothetical protein
LKHEQFLLNGRQIQLGWLQGPVAESAVRKDLRGLGKIMVSDATARYPMQISWGANSIAAPSVGDSPMLLRIVRKGRFLRRAPVAHQRRALRPFVSIATALGVGQAAIALAQAGAALRPAKVHPFTAAEHREFGQWADEVWEKARSAYALIAVRDAHTLNRVMPPGQWPDAIPLEVRVDGRVVGWAALRDRTLEGDPLFGDLRAGSVIDALAIPGFEATVAAAAVRRLQARGVDLIGACFLHPRWISAFQRAGCLAIPKRRNIGFSKEMIEAAGGLDVLMSGTHLALIDSDGPRLF